MKKFGAFLMYIPLIWWLGWLFIFSFTPYGSDMDTNIGTFLNCAWAILITPATWAMIVIGIIGYLIHNHK